MTLMVHRGAQKVTREELALIMAPPSTETHLPIAHIRLVEALFETLSFRHINVVREEYAVSEDGMKMFGLLEVEFGVETVRFAIGVRNANDKSMSLALTVGYRVFVCDNMAFFGDFTPVFRKHTKHVELSDLLSIGVDRMQRNFEPLRKQILDWQQVELNPTEAKGIIYEAFVEKRLAPLKLMPAVHQEYFHPSYQEFRPQMLWSLGNAFTSAFKRLPPLKQYETTSKLAGFLKNLN
jgi:hypothetical protein